MTNFNQWLEDYKQQKIETITISKQIKKEFYNIPSQERKGLSRSKYMVANGTSETALDLYDKAHYFTFENNTTLEEEIEKIAQKETDNYKKQIEKKVKKHVGNIIEWELGNMEYIVHGTEGKAKVEAIYAGGYNIQRLHVRVIVKKLK